MQKELFYLFSTDFEMAIFSLRILILNQGNYICSAASTRKEFLVVVLGLHPSTTTNRSQICDFIQLIGLDAISLDFEKPLAITCDLW